MPVNTDNQCVFIFQFWRDGDEIENDEEKEERELLPLNAGY